MQFVCDSVSFNGHQVNVKSLTWGLENAAGSSVSCSSQWVENPFLNWGGRRKLGGERTESLFPCLKEAMLMIRRKPSDINPDFLWSLMIWCLKCEVRGECWSKCWHFEAISANNFQKDRGSRLQISIYSVKLWLCFSWYKMGSQEVNCWGGRVLPNLLPKI